MILDGLGILGGEDGRRRNRPSRRKREFIAKTLWNNKAIVTVLSLYNWLESNRETRVELV